MSSEKQGLKRCANCGNRPNFTFTKSEDKPVYCGYKGCRLSGLRFSVDAWNYRPIEDELASDKAKLVEALKDAVQLLDVAHNGDDIEQIKSDIYGTVEDLNQTLTDMGVE